MEDLEVKPISPKDVVKEKAKLLPPIVIACWNTLITKNFNGRYSNFKLKDLVAEIEAKTQRNWQYQKDQGWLDAEDVYRKEGWKVEFDKPDYTESYDSNFTFTAPKTNYEFVL